jgi:hypothetical protein
MCRARPATINLYCRIAVAVGDQKDIAADDKAEINMRTGAITFQYPAADQRRAGLAFKCYLPKNATANDAKDMQRVSVEVGWVRPRAVVRCVTA